MKLGFDSEKYLEEQSQYILQRVNAYDKLYLEFGGKLIGDFHAMRVLPGFDPDGKSNYFTAYATKQRLLSACTLVISNKIKFAVTLGLLMTKMFFA